MKWQRRAAEYDQIRQVIIRKGHEEKKRQVRRGAPPLMLTTAQTHRHGAEAYADWLSHGKVGVARY